MLIWLTASPLAAADFVCQPLAGFTASFETKAKENGIEYAIYRIDGKKAKEFLSALDSTMGRKSEDLIYSTMTGMLIIISPTDTGYVGILKDEEICLGAVLPMDAIVDALRKVGGDAPV